MSEYEIGKAIEDHNDKMARIERLTAIMGATESERLSGIRQNAALGLARTQGSKLTQPVVDSLLNEVILRPEVIAAVTTGTDLELPKTADQWDALAVTLVEENPGAKMCVVSRSREEREAIWQEEYQNIPHVRRLAMSRNANELDEYLSQRVRDRLTQKAGW